MLSKIGQSKQTQVLFIARIFLQQFFQGKADIQRQVTQIVYHQHKLQVCSFDGNSKHNWTNKTDAASIHRPYFPPTDFQGEAAMHWQITQTVSHQHKLQVCSLDGNSKHNWIKKTDAASIDRTYFPQTDFSRQADIQRQISKIVSHQHKLQVCS